MDVPELAFVRDLRMGPQEVERISRSTRINFFQLVEGKLLLSLVLHAHAAIEQGKVVVGCQVIRIDGLQRLELLQRLFRAVLLIVGHSQFAPRVPRLRELLDDFFQVRNLSVIVSVAPLDERMIEGCAWVTMTDPQSGIEGSSSRAEFLPSDVGEPYVGITVRVVRPQLDHFTECVNRFGVLQLIQIGDTEVVPPHPIWIVAWIGAGGEVLSNAEQASP